MRNLKMLLLGAALTGFVLSGCKKDAEMDDQQLFAEEMSYSMTMDEEIDLETDEIVLGLEPMSGDCPVITWAQPRGTFPNTVTIDFGTDGCEDRKGRIRKGIIRVNVSGDPKTAGTSITTSFENHFVEDVQFLGSRVLTLVSIDDQKNKTINRVVDMQWIFPDDGTANRQANHTIVQLDGGDTRRWLDDALSISGSGSGTNKAGATYTHTITQNLEKQADCRFISSGVLEAVIPRGTLSVNFGDGTCDHFAEATLPNGRTRTIPIGRFWRN
jgi:hypothetical protein